MPNPFHYRARIDRLWRRANGRQPAYLRLNALNALVRELFATNERARLNYRLYLATDPFDVARHKLRDLYDHGSPLPSADGGGRGHEVAEESFPPNEESSEEDDDPL